MKIFVWLHNNGLQDSKGSNNAKHLYWESAYVTVSLSHWLALLWWPSAWQPCGRVLACQNAINSGRLAKRRERWRADSFYSLPLAQKSFFEVVDGKFMIFATCKKYKHRERCKPGCTGSQAKFKISKPFCFLLMWDFKLWFTLLTAIRSDVYLFLLQDIPTHWGKWRDGSARPLQNGRIQTFLRSTQKT